MSGSWRDGAALRLAIEADALRAGRRAIRVALPVTPRGNWIVTQLPPTVEPQSFHEGRDLAAMAHVEGWR